MLRSAQVEQLNRDCYCFPFDSGAMTKAIGKSQPTVAHMMTAQPNLFANSGVLLAKEEVDAMRSVVAAVESLVNLPAFQLSKFKTDDGLNKWRDNSSTGNGLLMGYDFHMGADGPQLIEINTNAGGAFIASEMMGYCRQVLPECCGFKSPAYSADKLKNLLVSEWRSAKKEGLPTSAAIIDSKPQSQYLYPDMLIAKNYFEACGIETVICDVASLEFQQGVLSFDGKPIDIVYNRSTDFKMEGADHAALREAALQDAAPVSPNPVHHALYADKRNFIDMCDREKLTKLGLKSDYQNILKQHVPQTWLLTEDNAADLYARRKSLFFKPVDGFGSRAVYRGDKLTRRVWDEIVQGNERQYIAQQVVPPSLRAIVADGERKQLKFDVRIYTVGGEAVMSAARVYQGQTTNFRTIGGGFAPVFSCDG